MDISNKQAIACYIDSNKILFYQGATGSMISLEFPPDVISFLDLVHKEKFEQLIEDFIKQNNIVGGNVILVYSSTAAFEKDFQEDDPTKEDTEIQKFIDLVPFEDVLSKIYKLNKKTKVVAINNRVYESIRIVLEKSNFLVYAVVPASVLSETIPELSQTMDLGTILRKIDSLKQYSLITGSEVNNQALEKKPETKKQNKRLYAFGGVFGILLIVLIAMIANNLLSKPPAKSSGQIGAPPPVLPKPTSLETSQQNAVPAVIETPATPSSSVLQRP